MTGTGISVIVPIYNVEEYLGECLDSLAQQDYSDIEVIMVDDGSSDGSASIAERFADADARFRYIRKENAGVSAARNTGLQYASGEFLCFVDSDDVIPHDALGKMYRVACDNEADIVVGKVMRLRDEAAGTSRMSEIIFSEYEKNTSIRKNHALLYDTITCCKLYRKTYWDSLGIRYPEDLAYCEDLPVALQLYCGTDKVVMLDEAVYLWRIRDGEDLSSTQQKNLRMVEQRISSIKRASDFIRNQVRDDSLLADKKYKDLFMDLNILINKAVDLDNSSLRKAMAQIRRYMREEGLRKELKRLPLIYEKKYKAVLLGNYRKLKDLRDFQLDEHSSITTEKKEGRLYGIYPNSIVFTGKADLRTTIEAELLRQNVLRVDVREDRVVIICSAYLRYLPVSKCKDVNIKVWLVDEDRNKIREIKVKKHTTQTPNKLESRKNANDIDYTGTGFNAVLFSEDVEGLEAGSYRFLVDWESQGYHREAIIPRLKPEDVEKIEGTAVPGTTDVTMGVTLNREPMVIVK